MVTPSHCVYLMQSLHHNLLDVCKYLMMQSSIWQMVCTRTSEDSVLDILEGSVRRGRGQVPRGGAPPPPPRPPVSLEQLLATQNDLMRRLVENDERHGAEHQQTPTSREGFFILKFSGNSPVSLCRCDRPLRGRQLASHHRVQVWATPLYRVSKESVRCTSAQRHSCCMVGFLHRHPT
jgi:hypothetical protein